MVRCERPRLTAVKSVTHGSDWVGSQPHGSIGQWPIVERCTKSIVTFMCSAVYLRNTGISLSNLMSKTACVGGAFAAHAFHHLVSPMYWTCTPLTWGYDTELPGKGLPLARPQRTEEKGTACTLEKPNLNAVDAFGALLAKILGAETPPQKGCTKGVPAHKGCAERVQKGGSSAQSGVHKGRTKGAQRV